MNFKKILGGTGAVICMVLLTLVAARVITWKLFWLLMIIIAGIAYWVLPKME